MKYYISIVVATKNDNHGGNMKEKNIFFLKRLFYQLKKVNFNCEIIIVDWCSEKLLYKKIKIPKNLKNIKVVFINVSKEIYKFKNLNKKINFYQMYAKNIGIRNAIGEYILSTNIDILLSDKLIKFLSKKKLINNYIYRTDRKDIDFKDFRNYKIVDKDLEKKITVINKLNDTIDIINNKKYPIYLRFNFEEILPFIKDRVKNFIKNKKINKKNITYVLKKLNIYIRKYFSFNKQIKLHTNASGDFILMDKKSWFKVNGFYELNGYSWHLDSLLMWKCHYNNIKQIILNEDIYHINHNIGSGYTPGNNSLFEKLKKNKIKYLTNMKLNKIILKLQKKNNYLNNKFWGQIDKKTTIKILSEIK